MFFISKAHFIKLVLPAVSWPTTAIVTSGRLALEDSCRYQRSLVTRLSSLGMQVPSSRYASRYQRRQRLSQERPFANAPHPGTVIAWICHSGPGSRLLPPLPDPSIRVPVFDPKAIGIVPLLGPRACAQAFLGVVEPALTQGLSTLLGLYRWPPAHGGTVGKPSSLVSGIGEGNNSRGSRGWEGAVIVFVREARTGAHPFLPCRSTD